MPLMSCLCSVAAVCRRTSRVSGKNRYIAEVQGEFEGQHQCLWYAIADGTVTARTSAGITRIIVRPPAQGSDVRCTSGFTRTGQTNTRACISTRTCDETPAQEESSISEGPRVLHVRPCLSITDTSLTSRRWCPSCARGGHNDSLGKLAHPYAGTC